MIAEYYLLPQLEVDESGITAHYGPDVVHIAWQNIRYFALIDCKMIRRPSSPELPALYEICDGENSMNWYAQPLMKTRQPLPSSEQYTRFLNEHLPALVSKRTELPLLDLRQPKRAESLVEQQKLRKCNAMQSGTCYTFITRGSYAMLFFLFSISIAYT